MATVTAPIMTDATGQSIDSKLNSLLGKMDNLAAAFQPNASGIAYNNTTSGLTGDDVQEAIDEMAADVSEIKQSLSLLGGGNFEVLTYFNATKIEIDMGFVPTGSKLGMAVLFNANQGEADFLNLAASPGIGRITGNKSWTSAISGTKITFTPSNTLWGITMVLLLHN